MKVRPSISGTCGQAFQALIDVDSGWDADPRAIVAAAHRFDMASSKIETRSVDAGTSWAVLAADGQPLRSADARGFVLAHAYDALRRPTTLTVTPPTGPAFVAERLVYGDDPSVAPVDPTAYLVGRVYRQYDGAGILTYDRYDFKGNSIEQTRQLITTRSGAPDWSSPYLTPLKSRTEYDALNRPTRMVVPRLQAGGYQNTFEPGYDKNSRIARIRVQPQHGPLVLRRGWHACAQGRRVRKWQGPSRTSVLGRVGGLSRARRRRHSNPGARIPARTSATRSTKR